MASPQSELKEKLTLWLLGTKKPVSEEISLQLRNGLFTSLPIFFGGAINTLAVASLSAWYYPQGLFLVWLGLEIILALTRVGLVIHGRRLIAAGANPPWLTAALLAIAWSASVGFGTIISLTSGDWILAIIVCLSASAMVCGICLRNFGTPRLAAVMVFTVLAPCAVGGFLSGEPILIIITIQLPIYMITIFAAAFSLHHMLVSRMIALGDLERSETLNETILRSSPDYTLILNADGRVDFCNRPETGGIPAEALLGQEWLSLLAEDDRAAGSKLLDHARAGRTKHLVTHTDVDGQRSWFDVIASSISDDSGRLIVVARDITHQKKSEERALWMALHDSLTGLPNRTLLQDRLDGMLSDFREADAGALLVLDVDNFKTINDTLGHDAGDALLCTFAERLQSALTDKDLVARTGGDEFAIIVGAKTEEQVQEVVDRIYSQLREPFCHEGRLLECGASIGASLIPRDGQTRSEVLKAADIALYAAKAGGRAQLKLFEPAMMTEVERHQAMIASARRALQNQSIVPHYQPKISLRTSRVTGFEALLRWRDDDGQLYGPDVLKAAFDDPALGGPLSDTMLARVLDDARIWLNEGLEFGHIAINVTASDFRRGCFAENLLARLKEKDVPPEHIQIEVTETVFLGRSAGYVEEALKCLSEHGVRIALDDFGTGYASLSHLNQFPVDMLKIDRSFVSQIGLNSDAEAIAATVINLGHCLGLEVIAEGIETPAQESHLLAAGCDTGQGYLYAKALPADAIPQILRDQEQDQDRDIKLRA